MSNTILLIFELLGTISFAISGALTGLKKQMDIFGVAILGIVTAVGGGVMRDVILGITPPIIFKNPVFVLVAVATALITFFPTIRKLFHKSHRHFELLNLIMDSIGLGVFTVVGIRTAAVSFENNFFLLLFVGIITGVGGGVLRDVLSGNTPYIFIKHFYASASLIGAFVCILLWQFAGEIVSMSVGAAAIVVLRLLAAHFHWSLPHAKE